MVGGSSFGSAHEPCMLDLVCWILYVRSCMSDQRLYIHTACSGCGTKGTYGHWTGIQVQLLFLFNATFVFPTNHWEKYMWCLLDTDTSFKELESLADKLESPESGDLGEWRKTLFVGELWQPRIQATPRKEEWGWRSELWVKGRKGIGGMRDWKNRAHSDWSPTGGTRREYGCLNRELKRTTGKSWKSKTRRVHVQNREATT